MVKRLEKQYPITLSADQRAQLGQIARERGMAFSTLVRSTMIEIVINPWLARQEERTLQHRGGH